MRQLISMIVIIAILIALGITLRVVDWYAEPHAWDLVVAQNLGGLRHGLTQFRWGDAFQSEAACKAELPKVAPYIEDGYLRCQEVAASEAEALPTMPPGRIRYYR